MSKMRAVGAGVVLVVSVALLYTSVIPASARGDEDGQVTENVDEHPTSRAVDGPSPSSGDWRLVGAGTTVYNPPSGSLWANLPCDEGTNSFFFEAKHTPYHFTLESLTAASCAIVFEGPEGDAGKAKFVGTGVCVPADESGAWPAHTMTVEITFFDDDHVLGSLQGTSDWVMVSSTDPVCPIEFHGYVEEGFEFKPAIEWSSTRSEAHGQLDVQTG